MKNKEREKKQKFRQKNRLPQKAAAYSILFYVCVKKIVFRQKKKKLVDYL